MKKNLHDKILKKKLKEQYLSLALINIISINTHLYVSFFFIVSI